MDGFSAASYIDVLSCQEGRHTLDLDMR